MKNKSWVVRHVRMVGVALIIVALVIMQSSNAAAAPAGGQQTNWSNVTKVGIGGSIGALGMGGLICGLLTVGCPVGIAIAGGVLGAIGGTIALFPEPPAPTSPFPSGPSNWPDAPTPTDPCGISCGGSNGGGMAGGGGSAFGQGPDDVYKPLQPPNALVSLPTSGKVKVLMAMPEHSNSFAVAAKKLGRSFDWRQSAFDTTNNILVGRQRSGLFVGAPVVSPRTVLKLSPRRIQIQTLPTHRPLGLGQR